MNINHPFNTVTTIDLEELVEYDVWDELVYTEEYYYWKTIERLKLCAEQHSEYKAMLEKFALLLPQIHTSKTYKLINTIIEAIDNPHFFDLQRKACLAIESFPQQMANYEFEKTTGEFLFWTSLLLLPTALLLTPSIVLLVAVGPIPGALMIVPALAAIAYIAYKGMQVTALAINDHIESKKDQKIANNSAAFFKEVKVMEANRDHSIELDQTLHCQKSMK